MHPLLALLATRPQLLVDHAQAYAELFNEEFALARAAWRRQVLLFAVALCCLGVAAVLAGVATLLWFTTAGCHTVVPWHPEQSLGKALAVWSGALAPS